MKVRNVGSDVIPIYRKSFPGHTEVVRVAGCVCSFCLSLLQGKGNCITYWLINAENQLTSLRPTPKHALQPNGQPLMSYLTAGLHGHGGSSNSLALKRNDSLRRSMRNAPSPNANRRVHRAEDEATHALLNTTPVWRRLDESARTRFVRPSVAPGKDGGQDEFNAEILPTVCGKWCGCRGKNIVGGQLAMSDSKRGVLLSGQEMSMVTFFLYMDIETVLMLDT